MQKINEVLKKHALKPHRYEKNGKATIIDTDLGRFVLKEKKSDSSIYQYLNSRSFDYYPKIVSNVEDEYEITEYVDDIEMPEDQKATDMVDLVSLLHNKTTHYQEVDEDDYKKIYEDIANNIEYLYSYYNDVITIIETHVYMSPSEFLFARNVSKIYSSLAYAKQELENWHNLIKEKRKQRMVVLHNNLDTSHFIRGDAPYLINWDKAKVDIPIFDLYKLYKRHALDFDFSELLRRYEHNYPLLQEERILLFILIALPDKIEFSGTEFQLCQMIGHMIDTVYKTEILISPYYTENRKQDQQ